MMEISKELAYLLGVLRDGNIQVGRNKSGTYYFIEFMSKNKKWLRNLANLLKKLCGKCPTIRAVIKNNRIYWRLRLRNKNFVTKLVKLTNFVAPQWKWNPSLQLNDKNMVAYLAGFFDTEGYLSKSSTTHAWNIGVEHSWENDKSCPPLIVIKDILIKYGINSNKITFKKKGRKRPLFCLRITQKNSVIKFCKLVKSKSLHPEKIKKINSVLSTCSTP